MTLQSFRNYVSKIRQGNQWKYEAFGISVVRDSDNYLQEQRVYRELFDLCKKRNYIK